MSSKVFFLKKEDFSDKNFLKLFSKLDFPVKKDELVAVKLHFGEKGNKYFIKPNLVKPFVDELKKTSKPFLTDCNTLYRGERANSFDHLNVAKEHGFFDIGVPVIIGDGLRGENYKEIEVNLKHFKTVKVGGDVTQFDSLLVISHFKGHGAAGFGGALKNAGMGFGSRPGKLEMHSKVRPIVDENTCISCGTCEEHCPTGAIKRRPNEKGKASVDEKTCIGCGMCISVCPVKAVKVPWGGATEDELQERMVEYAVGVLKNKKAAFINFLIDISPDCDCFDKAGKPFTEDIGVLASNDPVALDKASHDLVTKQADFDWHGINVLTQMNYAQEVGLGKKDYELIEL